MQDPISLSTVFSYTKPHYIIMPTHQKQPLFQDRFSCELLLNIITYNKYALYYRVFGMVIMPDSLHIIFYSSIVQLYQVVRKTVGNFDRYYHQITGKLLPFWDSDYYAYALEDYDVLKRVQAHIHREPVRQGLVNDPEDYLYSSCRFYEQGADDFILLLDKLGD